MADPSYGGDGLLQIKWERSRRQGLARVQSGYISHLVEEGGTEGVGSGEEGTAASDQEQQPGPEDWLRKQKKGRVIKMAGLYRDGQLGEGSPAPGLEKFRLGGRVCQPEGPYNR